MPTVAPKVTDRLNGVRAQLSSARAQLLAARAALADLRSEIDVGRPGIDHDPDVGAATAASLRRVTEDARSTERALASVLVEIAGRTDQLAATGSESASSEALLGSGQVSGGTARRESARARVAESMPQMGDALASGTIGGEHLDAVARAAAHLDDQEQSALEARQSELASAAEDLPVDAFGRLVRR
jgi:hypothetical protein